MSQESWEISPEELSQRTNSGEKLLIVDVRNPDEFAFCRLSGSTLIPLHELPQRLHELDPDQEIVVHCKMGGRSGQAVAFLRQQGFSRVRNLTGGILAWSERIDPTVPRY